MRSLVFSSAQSVHVPGEESGGDAFLSFFAPDRTVFVVSESHSQVSIVRVSPHADNAASLAVSYTKTDAVVGAHFIHATNSILIAHSDGDLRMVESISATATATDNTQAEVVGTVDSGIRCMESSPDGEMLVLVTGGGTLLLMTRDLDVLSEVLITDSDSGNDKPVALGWGKEETQFRGSQGKLSSPPQTPQQDVSATPSNPTPTSPSYDDGRPRLSWRRDGNFFALSTVSTVDGDGEGIGGGEGCQLRRVIRIFSREGVLSSTSERVDGLGSAVAWRTSTNLIASTQPNPTTLSEDVIFFERNGLRHGEFSLRDVDAQSTNKGARVKRLAWNADSSCLCVWLKGPSGQDHDRLQLWTVSNYAWHLAQDLPERDVRAVEWDPVESGTLHVVSRDRYCMYTFHWAILQSSSLGAENPATVAAIDGAKLKLTPLAHQVVPPPMSTFSITPSASGFAPIRHVSFARARAGDDFAVLTCTGDVQVFEGRSVHRPAKVPVAGANIRVPDGIVPRQVSYAGPNEIYVLGHDDSKDVLVLLCSPDKHVILTLPTRMMLLIDADKMALLQGVDGSLWKVPRGSTLTVERFAKYPKLPMPCVHVAAVDGSESDPDIVALSPQHGLYVNGRLLFPDVTSFFVHSDFLLCTTLSHTLKCVQRSRLSESTGSAGTMSMEESHRRIERGATIVTALQGGLAVILQMPRGNLETIYPRALAITTLQKKLDSANYREALELCREHRISMNLLCDHNRTKFLEDISSFVSQVKKVDHLNLFISSLIDEDVTTTQYKMFYNNRTPTPQEDRTKVTAVCQKLRSDIQSLNSEEYFQTLLTTFVKESPPRLEDALTSIQSLRQMKGSKAADEATKYIVFLVDANTLFDVALGMYDFGLVMMIAQHSHKDPKEYLAFLSQLRSLDKPVQRFRIDDYLKRHSKALKNLSEAGQDHFSEALTYVSRHKLHSVALDIFSEKSQRKEVLKLFGERLVDERQYCEAGIMYDRAECYLEAIESYSRGLFWREAMASAHLAKQDKESIEKLCTDMADELREDRRWNDAAELLLNFSEDVEGAVRSYCLGGSWEQATLAALSRVQEALVESVIKPALKDGLERVSSELSDISTSFDTKWLRLQKVREEKLMAPAVNFDFDDRLDNIDVMSVASSLATTLRSGTGSKWTSFSTSTRSKNRRKFERKKLSGKEGSQYEEEYLVTYFKKTFERVDSLRGDLTSLLLHYVRHFGASSEARNVQALFVGVLDKMASAKERIFVPFDDIETAEQLKERLAKGLDPITGQPLVNAPTKYIAAPPVGVWGEKLKCLEM